MKKILFVLAFLFTLGVSAQVVKRTAVLLDTLTTAELNALPSSIKVRGSLYYDRTKGNHVTWDPVTVGWVNVGDGLGTARDVGPFTVVDADNATLDAGAVANGNIANDAVTSVKIADGTIVGNDIQDGAVNSAKIADGSITGTDVLDGSIQNTDITPGAILENRLSVTNVPTAGYNLTYDAGGGFTWASLSAQLSTLYPNLDTDGTNDVTIAGSQDVTGEKTFQTTSELVAAARFENEQTGQDVRLQMLADNPTGTPVGFWFGGYADGTNNWFSWSRASDLSSYAMRLDRDNGNMEIFGNIITPGTVDGVDVSALPTTNLASGDQNLPAAVRTIDIDASGQLDIDANGVAAMTIDGSGGIDFPTNTPTVPGEVYGAGYENNDGVVRKGDLFPEMERKINSDITGEPPGSYVITNIIGISRQNAAGQTFGAGTLAAIDNPIPATVVTSATIAMDGWKMYNDETADAATITLSDCEPGETLTVYINRASAPTLAGTGLTFNQLPNTTAFAAATQMAIYFEVSHDGTTVDYFYFER
ncbi:hypothetical protein [Robiginitalea biformata]|uniref:Uncharacterized protein n=1 Tax=Robiginitalea biformata (strain ATCC BAA-864 / DSM 15991 / KCTC 12146 / HTCC2501) TaxID=313596 RepID=A4CP51_ROBBH|nr:hypothetical protein [Robiginitalea biformata]EAR14668.1 hypothetical protein RB2501_01291 [Robiginitalea biformata HTCC2501]